MTITLDALAPGKTCTVVKVSAGGQLGQRLMDLGFYPGVDVTVVRNAPLVDPVELRLDGYNVSIRHEEALHIEVKD